MKLFAIFLVFISFVIALPVTSPPGEIDAGRPIEEHPVEGRPVEGRPVEGRPVEGRPVTGRPVEPRPIGSRNLQARQGALYIVDFKEGYTHAEFEDYLAQKEVKYTISRVYNSPGVLVGVAIQLKNSGDYLKLEAWSGVQNIWISRIVSPTEPWITIPPSPRVDV